MRTLTDQLANYAAYHRDRRNIATHFIGIPMIVLAVAILFARPAFDVGTLRLSPILPIAALSIAYYFALDRRYGIVMGLVIGAAVLAGYWFAAQSTAIWLGWGLGLFVVGWFIQFVGHYYEGRKPAFVDDIIGLLIGPLFVAAEAGFAWGLREEVRQAIESSAGPTHGGEYITTPHDA